MAALSFASLQLARLTQPGREHGLRTGASNLGVNNREVCTSKQCGTQTQISGYYIKNLGEID